ncbi:hypothetical protein MMPV_001392 [Pyropia vietnamensis]
MGSPRPLPAAAARAVTRTLIDAVAATAGADAADLAWAAGLPPPSLPDQVADGAARHDGWPPPLPAACGGATIALSSAVTVTAPWAAAAWDPCTYAVELFDAAHAGATGGGGWGGSSAQRNSERGNPFGGGPFPHRGGGGGGGGGVGGDGTDTVADADADARVAAAVAAMREREAALVARQTGGLDESAVAAAVAALTALAAAADSVRAAASGGGRRG